MLYDMALADAYGIAFEFCDQPNPNDLGGYYQHHSYEDMVPGHYTDDTQRSIANAFVILNKGPEEWLNPLTWIESYQQVFKNDPRPGYSRRYEAFLKENIDVTPMDFALKIVRKPTNGSVMGAAVLGYIKNPELLMMVAAAQAISTHSYNPIRANRGTCGPLLYTQKRSEIPDEGFHH